MAGWPGSWAGTWAGGWAGSEGEGGGPVYLDAGFAALASAFAAFGSDLVAGEVPEPGFTGGVGGIGPRARRLLVPHRAYLDAGFAAASTANAAFAASTIVQAGLFGSVSHAAAMGGALRTAPSAGMAAQFRPAAQFGGDVQMTFAAAWAEEEFLLLLAA